MAAQSPDDPRTKLTRPFLYIYGEDVTGKKRPTNYAESVIHMVKGYVGTGIFALGAAFMFGGILLGPIILVLIAVICLHCQHILVKAALKISSKEVVDVVPSYAEVVRYTFEDCPSTKFQKCGRALGIATTVFILIAEYGTCIVYLIFIPSHIKEFSDAHNWTVDYRVWLAILLIPIWLPSILSNLKFLAPFCLLANVILAIGIGIILYYTSQNLPSIKNRYLVGKVEKWPNCFGIVSFAFMGIVFILNIRMEMKNRDRFTTPLGVLNVSMVIVVLLCVLVGIMSYWKYGDCIAGSTFLNLPPEEVLSQIAKIGTSVATLISYAFHMYVIFEVTYPVFFDKFGPFKHPTLMIGLYRSFLVIVSYLFANVDNRLDAFIGLAGGISGAAVSFLFPALIDLAMRHGELNAWIIIKDYFIIIIAIIGAIISSITSIMSIIEHMMEAEFGAKQNYTCAA